MTDRILNVKDIKNRPWQHGERFDARLGAVSFRIRAQNWDIRSLSCTR